MLQTTNVLLGYLWVFLPSCFSRFFYYQFCILFVLFSSWFYLFILFICIQFIFPCSYVSLSFSSQGTPLVALSFMDMSCRRPFLPRPCPQFFCERDTLSRMMKMIKSQSKKLKRESNSNVTQHKYIIRLDLNYHKRFGYGLACK